MKKIFLAVLATFGLSAIGFAQQNGNFFTRNMEYQFKTNLSLGGSTPLGIPSGNPHRRKRDENGGRCKKLLYRSDSRR